MRFLKLVLLISLALPALARAQTGNGSSCCQTVSPRVQAGEMTLHEGNDASGRQWLQAVVLWRSSSSLNSGYSSADARDFQRVANAARSASQDQGRVHLGGVHANGYQYAEYDRERLWVLDQEFVLPQRDSALVVMVDVGTAPNTARVVGYSYIGAQMPDGFWSKSWSSGDTTFIVRSRNHQELLIQALRASPVVRAFIGEGAAK